MRRAREIFTFLTEAAKRGERTALVTITDVIGGSSRAPGMHMAVSETGSSRGSLSGGCVEAAVVGEAVRVIAQGRAEKIRFGAGSRFLDIRLPCGGGIDVVVTPDPPEDVILRANQALTDRTAAALELDVDGKLILGDPSAARTGWRAGTFTSLHQPDLRLFVIGHGAETVAMAGLAASYGAELMVLTPDGSIAERIRSSGQRVAVLNTPSKTSQLTGDEYSAVVMLFHDHDWEPELLRQALAQPHFYVGAMGSRGTHAIRLERLRELGVRECALERLTGPIGFIPAVRDPDTLALSVLGQIVAIYEALLVEREVALGNGEKRLQRQQGYKAAVSRP
ncbi:XdhC family protein [Sphingomonas sp. TX0543]|uniref:XdhC family protein n=1 Tax=Sphingomonas sp. TX0543 TaxID=3399682 RepID=UPI003AFB64D1